MAHHKAHDLDIHWVKSIYIFKKIVVYTAMHSSYSLQLTCAKDHEYALTPLLKSFLEADYQTPRPPANIALQLTCS